VFIDWKDAILYIPQLILAILLPPTLGYLIIETLIKRRGISFTEFPVLFFTGVFLTFVTFFICDLCKLSKNIGILATYSIMLLAFLIRLKWMEYKFDEDYQRNRANNIKLSLSLYEILIIVFGIIIFSSVYFNLNYFVKGDLWKHTILASKIQLMGLENYLIMRSDLDILTYTSLFPYFMASVSSAFSIPLVNLSIIYAIIIPAMSILAVLNFFLLMDIQNQYKGKWGAIIWFTFSGFGLIYSLMEHGSLKPSHIICLELLYRLGWGNGTIYSPSIGSFAHILRLFATTGAITSISTLIQEYNVTSKNKILIATIVLIISIFFHPISSLIPYFLFWFAFAIIGHKTVIYQGVTLIVSMILVLLFDLILIPGEFYSSHEMTLVMILAGLSLIIMTISTLLRAKIMKKYVYRLPGYLKIFLLVLISFCYFYSFYILLSNYKKLSLDGLQTIPAYDWVNLMGIHGLLVLTFLYKVLFRNSQLSIGDKYFIILATLTLLASMSLDYNNCYQVIKKFDPRIISFRLVPIMSLSISFISGSIYSILSSSLKLIPRFFGRILLIVALLSFVLISLFVRVNFWRNTNWPSIMRHEYDISKEELLLIHYIRSHVNSGEFVSLEDCTMRTIRRFMRTNPLGLLVSLAGANVLNGELSYIMFQSKSEKTVKLLMDTFNIRCIIIKKCSTNEEEIGYLKCVLLNSLEPTFETKRYAVYELTTRPSNITVRQLVSNLKSLNYFGIFTNSIEILGEADIVASRMQIVKLGTNGSILVSMMLKKAALILPKVKAIITSSPLKNNHCEPIFNHSAPYDRFRIINGIELRPLEDLTLLVKLLEDNQNLRRVSVNMANNEKLVIIFPENVLIRVKGKVVMKKAFLTWLLARKLKVYPLSLNLCLSGTVNFQLLNTNDEWIPMKLTLTNNINSYCDDMNRDQKRVANHYFKHYDKNLFLNIPPSSVGIKTLIVTLVLFFCYIVLIKLS